MVSSSQGSPVALFRTPPHRSTTFSPCRTTQQAPPSSPRREKFSANASRTASKPARTCPSMRTCVAVIGGPPRSGPASSRKVAQKEPLAPTLSGRRGRVDFRLPAAKDTRCRRQPTLTMPNTPLGPHAFTDVDGQADPQAWVEILDEVAREPFYVRYKRRIGELLDLQPGDLYLDVGGGTGSDLSARARAT